MGVGLGATAQKADPDPSGGRELRGSLLLLLETVYRTVQAGPSWSQLPGAGTTGVCHHDQLTVCWGQTPGLRAWLASSLPAELHPRP